MVASNDALVCFLFNWETTLSSSWNRQVWLQTKTYKSSSQQCCDNIPGKQIWQWNDFHNSHGPLFVEWCCSSWKWVWCFRVYKATLKSSPWRSLADLAGNARNALHHHHHHHLHQHNHHHHHHHNRYHRHHHHHQNNHHDQFHHHFHHHHHRSPANLAWNAHNADHQLQRPCEECLKVPNVLNTSCWFSIFWWDAQQLKKYLRVCDKNVCPATWKISDGSRSRETGSHFLICSSPPVQPQSWATGTPRPRGGGQLDDNQTTQGSKTPSPSPPLMAFFYHLQICKK